METLPSNMISDLRYLDPVSPIGAMQIRDILINTGTPPPVIDWVIETVAEQNAQTRKVKQELHQVLMDREQ